MSVSPIVTSNQPSLHVTWSAPLSDHIILHYQVDYRVDTSGSWSTWSPNPTSTSVTLTGLQRGTTYQVRVRAVSDLGSGAWSVVVSSTTYDGKLLSIGQLILIYTALYVNITNLFIRIYSVDKIVSVSKHN